LAQAILEKIPLTEAMRSQEQAFTALATGSGALGARGIITNGANAQFAYVARASATGATIVKFGSVTPKNSQNNEPVVQAHIAVLDQENGNLKYLIEGEQITIARTTAASMVAAKFLANPPKKILIIGNGLQGKAHLRATELLFPTSEKKMFDRRQPEDISTSDLIFLCTNSLEPVVDQEIALGATLISIGSFAPGRSEVGIKVFESVDKIFGDDANTCIQQCGSLINALSAGIVKVEDITSIGNVITRQNVGRSNATERILYFSVGLGIQDAAFIEMLERNESNHG